MLSGNKKGLLAMVLRAGRLRRVSGRLEVTGVTPWVEKQYLVKKDGFLCHMTSCSRWRSDAEMVEQVLKVSEMLDIEWQKGSKWESAPPGQQNWSQSEQ